MIGRNREAGNVVSTRARKKKSVHCAFHVGIQCGIQSLYIDMPSFVLTSKVEIIAFDYCQYYLIWRHIRINIYKGQSANKKADSFHRKEHGVRLLFREERTEMDAADRKQN